MKKQLLMIFFFISTSFCLNGQNTLFSDEALASRIILSDLKNETNLLDFMDSAKEYILIMYFWDSQNYQSVKILPKIKELQNKNPNIKFLFVSSDENKTEWLDYIGNDDNKSLNVILTDSKKSSIIQELRIIDLPRLIIIDKSKEIILNQEDEFDFEVINDFLRKIQ
jgi:hypothetical protein